jgi:hypothetical protein
MLEFRVKSSRQPFAQKKQAVWWSTGDEIGDCNGIDLSNPLRPKRAAQLEQLARWVCSIRFPADMFHMCG